MSEALAKIRRFPLSTDDWTPIVAPCCCNYFSFENADGTEMWRTSDPDNDEAWCKTWKYALLVPRLGPMRYQTGDIVTYLKALSGSGPAVVEFIP